MKTQDVLDAWLIEVGDVAIRHSEARSLIEFTKNYIYNESSFCVKDLSEEELKDFEATWASNNCASFIKKEAPSKKKFWQFG